MFARRIQVLCVCVGVGAFAAEPASPWVELLKHAGLTPETAQLSPKRPKGAAHYPLKTFMRVWDDWRRIEPEATSTARELMAKASSVSQLVAAAARRIGVQAKPGEGALRDLPKEALGEAIAALHQRAQAPLTDDQDAVLCAHTAKVPAAVAAVAAQILRAVPAALDARDRAFQKVKDRGAALKHADAVGISYRTSAQIVGAIREPHLSELIHGAMLIASRIDALLPQASDVSAGEFEFAWDTPLGRVCIGGTQPNTYEAGSYLLIVDAGGNDTYHSGANARGEKRPVSIVLDLGGDDRYESKEKGVFGAGVMGYGFLVDLAGNDAYSGKRGALGLGAFGVGVLMDCGGDDRYEIRLVGQGAGTVGVGVLADLNGNDEYRCFQQAQGYGKVGGCGVLVDLAGNDLYEANDTKIDYPAPQTKKHNTSLAQGCGFGLRGKPYLAGGVGVLVDGAGDDRYKCGVFGQGASYWFALGMLVDLAGNDSYEGVYYCQGTSAHLGVGALCDLEGDDRYEAKMNSSQGQGHDYSLGLLRDVRGNDRYTCGGGNALGSGHWTGIGIFWDGAGDDHYQARPGCMGNALRPMAGANCIGLFLDEGGENQFPAKHPAKPQSVWVRPKVKGRPHCHGLGMSK